MADGWRDLPEPLPLGATTASFPSEQRERGGVLAVSPTEFTGTTADLGPNIWGVSGQEHGFASWPCRALCGQREAKAVAAGN